MTTSCPRPSLQQHHRMGGGPARKLTFSPGTAPSVHCNAHAVPDVVARQHEHFVGSNQCCSAVVQSINASVESVWSVVRRFDQPQTYKHFIRSCDVIDGNGDVGTVREIHVVSGLPAISSRERLEILDDEHHILSFSVVGGEHRLKNYRSVTTLHATVPSPDQGLDSNEEQTIVVESYVVDIPPGNTREETRIFVDTIVRCNLQSLARTAEDLTKGVQGHA